MIKISKKNSPTRIQETFHRSAQDRHSRVDGPWIVEIQKEIGEVVQTEEEKDRGQMIEEEIVIVMEDAIGTVTEIVIESDVDRDHVIEDGRDHVIGNIENKPLPFTSLNCVRFCDPYIFRNEIYSCPSRRFKLVCSTTRKTSTTTIME